MMRSPSSLLITLVLCALLSTPTHQAPNPLLLRGNTPFCTTSDDCPFEYDCTNVSINGIDTKARVCVPMSDPSCSCKGTSSTIKICPNSNAVATNVCQRQRKRCANVWVDCPKECTPSSCSKGPVNGCPAGYISSYKCTWIWFENKCNWVGSPCRRVKPTKTITKSNSFGTDAAFITNLEWGQTIESTLVQGGPEGQDVPVISTTPNVTETTSYEVPTVTDSKTATITAEVTASDGVDDDDEIAPHDASVTSTQIEPQSTESTEAEGSHEHDDTEDNNDEDVGEGQGEGEDDCSHHDHHLDESEETHNHFHCFETGVTHTATGTDSATFTATPGSESIHKLRKRQDDVSDIPAPEEPTESITSTEGELTQTSTESSTQITLPTPTVNDDDYNCNIFEQGDCLTTPVEEPTAVNEDSGSTEVAEPTTDIAEPTQSGGGNDVISSPDTSEPTPSNDDNGKDSAVETHLTTTASETTTKTLTEPETSTPASEPMDVPIEPQPARRRRVKRGIIRTTARSRPITTVVTSTVLKTENDTKTMWTKVPDATYTESDDEVDQPEETETYSSNPTAEQPTATPTVEDVDFTPIESDEEQPSATPTDNNEEGVQYQPTHAPVEEECRVSACNYAYCVGPGDVVPLMCQEPNTTAEKCFANNSVCAKQEDGQCGFTINRDALAQCILDLTSSLRLHKRN